MNGRSYQRSMGPTQRRHLRLIEDFEPLELPPPGLTDSQRRALTGLAVVLMAGAAMVMAWVLG